MTLSYRVNFILLPVILLIFSFAGFVSYGVQKHQLHSLLSEKINYELKYIAGDLNDSINDLDSLSYLFLGSDAVHEYLQRTKNQKDLQYSKEDLTRYVKQIKPFFGTILSFGLIDAEGREIYLYDATNPFATLAFTRDLNNHLRHIDENIKEKGLSKIKTTTYQYKRTLNDKDDIILTRTFSPDLPIYNQFLSKNHSIFTSVLKVRLNHDIEYLQLLRSVLSKDIELSMSSSGSSRTIGNRDIIEKLSRADEGFGYRLKSDLFSVAISLPDRSLFEVYKPYKVLFMVVVSLASIITYVLLKSLITSRVIDPVVNLTQQVELSQPGEPINIERPESVDEVSTLTNKYIDLIEELEERAKFDSLTGLTNRSQFDYLLKEMVFHCSQSNLKFAVFYMDIDNFKSVNDRFGHHIGDQLLKSFSSKLIQCVREINKEITVTTEGESEFNQIVLGRISGDEFSLIIPNIQSIEDVELMAKRIISIFDSGFELDTNVFDIGVSIGISIYPDDAIEVNGLSRNADIAMYCAKKSSKSRYEVYTDTLGFEVERSELINESLRLAINEGQFYQLYMPIYDCVDGYIIGCEALLRTSLAELTPYGPDEYIPVAEKSGLIKDIDYWVIESAIKQLSLWIEQDNYKGLMAINFSSWQLKNPHFVDKIASLLKVYNVPPHFVELEITETCFVPGEYKNIEILSKLRELGVRLSLDDFGTGYTAFSQLIEYPIDTLKIDRMFINAIGENELGDKRPLVDMIAEIAKLYDLNVIAEGIETKNQLDYVSDLGCQQAQGYLLSKPISGADFISLWNSQKLKRSLRAVKTV